MNARNYMVEVMASFSLVANQSLVKLISNLVVEREC